MPLANVLKLIHGVLNGRSYRLAKAGNAAFESGHAGAAVFRLRQGMNNVYGSPADINDTQQYAAGFVRQTLGAKLLQMTDEPLVDDDRPPADLRAV